MTRPANLYRSRRLRGRAAAFVIGGAFLITMLGPTLPTPLYLIYQETMGVDFR
jgi:hypothetical protein